MKKSILVFVAALAAASASAQAVKVGIFDLKPHLSYNDAAKKAEGAAIEYLQDIASKTGTRLEVATRPPGR